MFMLSCSVSALLCYVFCGRIAKTADVSIVRLNEVNVLVFKVLFNTIFTGEYFFGAIWPSWPCNSKLYVMFLMYLNLEFECLNIRYCCATVWKLISVQFFLQRIKFGLGGRASRLEKDKLGPSAAAIGLRLDNRVSSIFRSYKIVTIMSLPNCHYMFLPNC